MTFLVPGAIQFPVHTNSRPRWAHGKPINLLLHFTGGVGMSHPGAERYAAEGIGSPFGLKQDGTLFQYMTDIDQASTWHAFNESMYGIGIEVEAGIGHPVTDKQIPPLIRWAASCCKHFTIPVVRNPGTAYGWGLKCHTDGLQPPEGPAKWDEHEHWDSPLKATGDPIATWISDSTRRILDTSPMSWATFIAEVKKLVSGGPPPPPPPNNSWPGRLFFYKPPTYTRGADVLKYKTRLAALGWNKPPHHLMAKDDVYGKAAHDNTVEFQTKHGLTPDGVVGEKTWNCIFNIS
jgi:peptidoglycan hydrolase-like protein with peptidoglycan-binding domain